MLKMHPHPPDNLSTRSKMSAPLTNGVGLNGDVPVDQGYTHAHPPPPPQTTPNITIGDSFTSVATEPISSEEFEQQASQQPEWHGEDPAPTNTMGCRLQNCVFVKNLQLTTIVGIDAWGNHNKPQPVLISVRVHREISAAGDNDAVNQTLSYSTIVKEIKEVVRDYERSHGGFTSARNLSESIFLKSYHRWGAWAVYIHIHLPKAHLRAEGGFHLESIFHEQLSDRLEESRIEGLRIPCIIGVNAHERETKQNVIITFKIIEDKDLPGTTGAPGTIDHWTDLSKQVVNITEASTFQTVEGLATRLADHIMTTPFVLFVNVSVEKPNAIASVEGSGCEVNRERSEGEHHNLVDAGPRVSLLYDYVVPLAPQENP